MRSSRVASRRAANHSIARRRGIRCSSQMLSSTAASGNLACVHTQALVGACRRGFWHAALL